MEKRWEKWNNVLEKHRQTAGEGGCFGNVPTASVIVMKKAVEVQTGISIYEELFLI